MRKLERDEMKNLNGGTEQQCTISCSCAYGGAVSCTGTTCEICRDAQGYCEGVFCGNGGGGSCLG